MVDGYQRTIRPRLLMLHAQLASKDYVLHNGPPHRQELRLELLALAALIHKLVAIAGPLAHAWLLEPARKLGGGERVLQVRATNMRSDHLAPSAREPIARHLKRYARDEHAAIRPHLLLELADELLCFGIAQVLQNLRACDQVEARRELEREEIANDK